MQKHRSENHCGVVCYIGIEPIGRKAFESQKPRPASSKAGILR
jgi:hypothetical protein